MEHGGLIHEKEDDVAVVISDVAAGAEVQTVTLQGEKMGPVTAIEEIPLGHKIALRDMAEGKELIKYGRAIGKTTQKISKGAHVHTQNVRSIRWETSIDE